MSAFLMPSLGSDMEAGTLVEWLKKPGEDVHRGDIVAVVETEKGAIEIESFEEGVFRSPLVKIGERVPVGTPIAMIGDGADASEPPMEPVEEVKAEAAPPVEPRSLPEKPAEEKVVVPTAEPKSGEGRLKISPAARRLAEAEGIDLASLAGTGPDGSIVLADVTRSLEQKPPRPETPGEEPGTLTGMRAAIAAAMTRSKREIPHYYLADTIDLTEAETFVAERNAGRPPEKRILLGALFVKAVALAAKTYPEFSGHFERGVFRPGDAVHAGVAINIRGGGLVAPAIHNADALNLETLMEKMRDLVARVRAGRFRATELSDPTITISSLGERGVESLYGVIYPPQVAIVGFGMPVTRPWVAGATIEARRVATMTLAADHRISDGHRGARFLNAISNLLREPETL